MLPDTPTTSPSARLVPLAVFVAVLWIVEAFDQILADGALDANGIRPRTIAGLDGVLWAPLLHGGFGHLVSNTLPLLILGALVAFRGGRRWLWVTGFIAVVGGLATWSFARPSIHIGASIIVFGYITYLVTIGLFERRLSAIALGVVVLVLYGGTLLAGVLPIDRGVSWEGHLFGALAGVAAAWVAGRARSRRPDLV